MRCFLFLLLGVTLAGCVPLVDGEGRAVPIVIQPAPVVVQNPNPNPVIIGQPILLGTPQRAVDDTIHVCTLKPFMDTFRAENTNRGRAMLEVQKQCAARYNGEMFCAKKDIKCSEYK